MARSPLLNVMVVAVRKAGRGLTRDFGEVENLQVSMKGPGDFVSAADKRAEEVLQEELKRVRPAFGFLMEESGAIEGDDITQRWVIDPLDGTTNFLHGIPQFAISLALEKNGVPIAGIVYNPVTDELFTAEKGSGAFLNDRRLRVAARREIADCVIGTGVPHLGRPGHAPYLAELRQVMANCAGIRRIGSAALDLAYVAAGRFDGYWEHGLYPWDTSAGWLLVKEAGGWVSDINGGDKIHDSRTIVAGNEEIHKQLLTVLAKGRRDAAQAGASAAAGD